METSSAASPACPGGAVSWSRAELAGQQVRPRLLHRRRVGFGDEFGVQRGDPVDEGGWTRTRRLSVRDGS